MWQTLIFCLLALGTQSAVLGIDFGSDFVKVAVVAPGHAFEIALDPSSKRKSPAVVGFDDGERRFGNDATSLITKRPAETYSYISRLLGKSIDSPIVSEFKAQYYPYQFEADEVRNTVRIKFGEDRTFGVEEIVSMYLKQAQTSAMNFLDSTTMIRDCVLTVPDFWTTKERRALLDAAELAGLNVLSLINENSAAALHYGIERTYELNETANFIFFNMGSTSTKVSIAQYDAFLKKISKRKNKTVGQVTVLSQAWDETLGGNAFDMVLVEDLKKAAEEQLNVDLSENYRAMGRLRVAAKKAKKVLSANKDTTVRVTSLYEDEDFKKLILREDFEKAAEDLFGRVIPPVEMALARAQLEKEDIEGIVLMGGGSRVPKIQELLVQFLGKDLKRDLNTDEAAALGAAFRAANESTTFRVRQIGFVDRSVFAVGATINNFADFETGAELEDAEFRKSAEIFGSGSQLKKRKAVHFKHDQELYVALSYAGDDGLPSGTSASIDHYNVSGIASAVEKYADANVTDHKPKISLSFSVDTSGVIKLSKATATFQENVEVAVPIVKNDTIKIETPPSEETSTEAPAAEESTEAAEETEATEGETETDEAAAEGEAAAEETSEEATEAPEESADTPEETADEVEESPEATEESTEAAEETGTAEGETGTDDSTTEGEATAEETAEKEETTTTTEAPIEYEYVWKTQKRKVNLKIRAMGPDVRPMNKTDMRNSTKVLLELDEADQAIRDTAAALNDLEAFVLERRPMLYEDEDEYIMQVSTEEERESLIALLSETEDWLFDVEDPTAGVFKAKLREVQKEVLPVFGRAYELSQRDFYVDETQKHLGVLRKMITNLTETMTWVNETEFEKLTKSCDTFEDWFTKKLEEQAEKELTDEPAFRVDEIKKRVEKLSDEVKRIAMRPKPAEKPKKKKKAKKKKNQ